MSSILFLAAVLVLGTQQALVAASKVSEEQCRAEGGSCVDAGDCMSPSWAGEACEGQGPGVCCNPSSNKAFQDALQLDGFEIGVRRFPCSNKKCLRWYKGFWTDNTAECTPKQRLVNFCEKTGMWCCAPPCREKPRCLRKGGYCVPRRSQCPSGRTRHRLCGGKMCFCCLPPFPPAPCSCSSSPVSVCDATSVNIADNTCTQITSPNYPNAYNHDLSCSLQVVGSPGSTLEVEHCEVALEKCPFDNLTVSDGAVSNTYCGSATPALFTASGNTVQLDFSTDFSQVNKGFLISVTSTLSCSSLPVYTMCTDTAIVTGVGGRLTTPNYPANYNTNQACTTTITVPTGFVIRFQYLAFHLEDTYPSCEFDYMLIYDTFMPNQNKFCDLTPPTFTTSTTNEVTVFFFSDKNLVYPGFNICFTAVIP